MGIYYHGTTEEKWQQIQHDGELKPLTKDIIRFQTNVLFVANGPDIAKNYGSVVLEVNYNNVPCIVNNNSIAIFESIPYENLRKLDENEIRKWIPIK